MSIKVYILISILLVAVGWINLHQLAPQEELFNSILKGIGEPVEAEEELFKEVGGPLIAEGILTIYLRSLEGP